MLRAFLVGGLIGAAFPGLLGGIFLALPIFFLAVTFFAGVASGAFSFFQHPAIALLAIGAAIFATIRTIGWISGRFPHASSVVFASVYAFFYGGMAYNIASGDVIWTVVVAAATGGYVYHRLNQARLENRDLAGADPRRSDPWLQP